MDNKEVDSTLDKEVYNKLKDKGKLSNKLVVKG